MMRSRDTRKDTTKIIHSKEMITNNPQQILAILTWLRKPLPPTIQKITINAQPTHHHITTHHHILQILSYLQDLLVIVIVVSTALPDSPDVTSHYWMSKLQKS
jgi:hypothetical protein